MECLERGRLIVWGALLPTPREDAEPCEGQGSYGRLVRLALLALLLIKTCAQKECLVDAAAHSTTCVAGTVDPGGASGPRTSCRCVPSPAQCPPIFGGRRRRESVPVVRRRRRGGGEQKRPQPLARRQTKGSRDGPARVGRWLCRSRQWPARDSKLGDEGVHEEDSGGDDTVIGGQRSGALDGLNAGGDQVGRAHVVGRKQPAKVVRRARGAALRVGQRLRTSPKIAVSFSGNHGRTCGKEFLSALVKRLVRRTVSPTRRRRCSTRCAKARMVGLWGLRGVRLSRCVEEALDLECGIGGVIFGPARGQRCAVRGHGARIDRKEPEEIIGAQRGHEGPFRAFQAHRDGLSVEARAEGLDPGMNRFRTMFKA